MLRTVGSARARAGSAGVVVRRCFRVRDRRRPRHHTARRQLWIPRCPPRMRPVPPAVGALRARRRRREGEGERRAPEPEASAADGDETSGKQSEGSDAAPTAAKPSLKPLTDEQRAKITTQVEFYFSDANLAHGRVPAEEGQGRSRVGAPSASSCGFNRVKQLLKKHPHTVVADDPRGEVPS